MTRTLFRWSLVLALPLLLIGRWAATSAPPGMGARLPIAPRVTPQMSPVPRSIPHVAPTPRMFPRPNFRSNLGQPVMPFARTGSHGIPLPGSSPFGSMGGHLPSLPSLPTLPSLPGLPRSNPAPLGPLDSLPIAQSQFQNILNQQGIRGRASIFATTSALDLASFGMTSSMGGYNQGGYSMSSSGGSQGASRSGGAVPVAVPQAAPETIDMDAVLDGLGLPHAQGYLAWPLGVRVLPTMEAGPLLAQIDAQLPEVAVQALGGAVDAEQVGALSQNVARLRRLLAIREKDLPQQTVADARRFLTQLDDVLKGMAQ